MGPWQSRPFALWDVNIAPVATTSPLKHIFGPFCIDGEITVQAMMCYNQETGMLITLDKFLSQLNACELCWDALNIDLSAYITSESETILYVVQYCR